MGKGDFDSAGLPGWSGLFGLPGECRASLDEFKPFPPVPYPIHEKCGIRDCFDGYIVVGMSRRVRFKRDKARLNPHGPGSDGSDRVQSG